MSVDKKKLGVSAISGVIWKFCERVGAQLVALVVQIILARLLSPDDYAVVGIITIFFSFCNVLITGGLNTALIQKKDSDIEDYSTVLHVSMILAAVLFVGMYFAAPWIANLYDKAILIPAIRVMSITFFINAFTSVLGAYVSSNLQFRKSFFATLVGSAVSAVVGISMAMGGFGPWALIAQQMTNAACNAVTLYVMARLKFVFRISWTRFRQLFGYGSKIFLTSLISVIYDHINPLIIGLKFTTADLAYYTKGQNYPGLLNSSVNDTLSTVLFPVIAKVQDSTEAVLGVTRRYIKVSSYIIFPVMVGFFAVAESFVVGILTEKWLPIVPYIRIFSFTYMFNIIQTGNLQAIKAIGRSDISLLLEILKKSVYFVIIAAFVYFSDSPIMLAASGILCTVVATVINTYPNRKLIGYSYRHQLCDLMPNFTIAVLMGIVVMLAGRLPAAPLLLLVIQVLVGGTVYVALSILFKNESFFYLLGYLKSFLKRK